MLSEHTYVGKYISNYRLLDKISSGPICSVYRAEHMLLKHRIVTIKMFQTPPLSQQNQFLQEVQLLRKLKHPHILPILDADLYENVPYIVTDYAQAGSLRNRIQARPTHLLSLQEIAAILHQLGQALQYAHQRNIPHSNLKPENILFTPENEILLTDFRIGTLLDGTKPDASYNANTWPYMAPEQFLGTRDKDSDQYALGCLAYELFTGRGPFLFSTFSTIAHKHLTENPIAPTHLNLLLPFPIGEAVLKALEKKSVDRYPSVKDFLTALSLSMPGHNSTPKLPRIDIASPSSPRPFTNHASSVTSSSKDAELKQENPGYSYRVVLSPSPAPTLPPPQHRLSTEQQESIAPSHNNPLLTPAPLPQHIQDLTHVFTKQVTVSEETTNPQTNEEPQSQIVTSEEGTHFQTNEVLPQMAVSKEIPDVQADQVAPPQMAASEEASNVQVSDTSPSQNEQTALVLAGNNLGLTLWNASQPQPDQTTQKLPVLSSSVQQDSAIGTAASVTSVDSKPISSTFIRNSRAKSAPNQFSRRTWLIIGGLWLVIAALIFGLIHTVLPSTSSPIATSTPIAHQMVPTPALNPLSTPVSSATPNHSSAPKPVPTASPSPSPSPTPSPTPPPPRTSTLIVTPTSFQGSTDCQRNGNYYHCTLLLQLPLTHQSNLHWSASSSGIFASFTPSKGILFPGEQQSVSLYVIANCSHTGHLIISSKDGIVSIPWSC